MTLIQAMIASEDVIVVSSDTRNALMLGDKVLKGWEADDDKFVPLSTHCVFAGGGFNSFRNHVSEELLKRKTTYLDEYFVELKKIIKGMKKNVWFRGVMKDDEHAQLFILGFDSQGQPGIIHYSTGGSVERIQVNQYPAPFIVAPSEDEVEAVTANFVFKNYNPNTVLNTVTNMVNLQAAFYANDSSTVSEEFVYYALEKTEQGLMCYRDKILLNGEVNRNEKPSLIKEWGIV